MILEIGDLIIIIQHTLDIGDSVILEVGVLHILVVKTLLVNRPKRNLSI